MKVTIRFSGKKNDPCDDYGYGAWAGLEITAGAEDVAVGGGHAGDNSESPEDANLGRDYSWFYSIPGWLRAAHKAGADGEPFELVEIENAD